jgi:hypothetical protein
MSLLPPPPESIDRREALRRTALLLGGAISAPTLAAMLAGCETPAAGEAGWTPAALSNEQGAQVATIAEHILPTTDTPGARGAGVHRFIDKMLAEYYSPDERTAFLAGLADVDKRAKDTTGKTFLNLSVSQQREVLAALDAEAYHQEPAHASYARPKRQPFFRTMKELTLLGYYTSQSGATQELKYAPIPGRFDGCVPLATIGRAWST